MRLVARAPTADELARMYHELAARGAPGAGERRPWRFRPRSDEDLLALALEMSRYDPRLLGIVVAWLARKWDALDPLAVRRAARALAEPALLGVAADLAREAVRDEEARYFFEYLRRGLRPVATQLYFLGTYPPGGKLAARAAERSPAAFRRWGFLAAERPVVDVGTKRQVGRYGAETRRRLLARLLEERGALRLAEYLDAVDRSVTRQQALNDLRAAGLQPRGHGPGARWARR